MTVLDWVPTQELEVKTLPVTLDTGGMPDGWHDLSLEVVVADGTQRRVTRLVVPVRTRNGNTQSEGDASGPEPARSSAWVAREVAGGGDPLYHGDTESTDNAAGDWRMELIGEASVQASTSAPGESLGSVWTPEWNVTTGQADVPATFFLSFDPVMDRNDLGDVQINEWPLTDERFSATLYPSADTQRVFARVTQAGALSSLASVLVFDVDVVDVTDVDSRSEVRTMSTLAVPETVTLAIPIVAHEDDAEERMTSGNVSLGSSDLEMTLDRSRPQTIGLRFQNVNHPARTPSSMTASIQFTADEVNTGPTALTIQGEAQDNPPAFADVEGNITSRTTD